MTGSCRERRAVAATLTLLLVVAAVACSGPSRYEPIRTTVNGQTVFVIYPPPPCPKNADCALAIVIDKQLYGITLVVPKAEYRTGPLYAVGNGQEAREIVSLSSSGSRVLALRTGSSWSLAFSPGGHGGVAFQRLLCEVMQDLPRDSYCVTRLGFTTTEPFDPAKVPAPAANGHGPAGTCDGTESTPPCGPGVVVGRYYPYAWAPDCSERAVFDGLTWQGTLRPPGQQPATNGWMILVQSGVARWTSPNGTDGLTPASGPAPACPGA